jgi:hypothetical protein
MTSVKRHVLAPLCGCEVPVARGSSPLSSTAKTPQASYSNPHVFITFVGPLLKPNQRLLDVSPYTQFPKIPEGVRGGTDRLAAGASGGAHLRRRNRLSPPRHHQRRLAGRAPANRRTGSPNVTRQAGVVPLGEPHIWRRLDAGASEEGGAMPAVGRLNRRWACRTRMAPAAGWRCGSRRTRPSARSLLVGAGSCYWPRSWLPRRPR